MNKDAILTLADIIEQQSLPKVRFDMSTYGDHDVTADEEICGTVCCIAGTAVIALGNVPAEDVASALVFLPKIGKDIKGYAAELLGLDVTQKYDLFEPRWSLIHKDLRKVTKEEAARTLRHLAETGRVDWQTEEKA